MTILFTLVNFFLIALLSRWEWRRSGATETFTYWSALSLRLISGIAIGFLYRFYYHYGDTSAFFYDAGTLTDLFYSDTGAYLKFLFTGDGPVTITTEPRSAFFVTILSIVNLLTHSNYWLSSLWFSWFSFWCSYRLVLKLDSVFPSHKVASRAAILFVPSVVFWTSGIIKESLAFGALTIIVTHFLSVMRGERPVLAQWIGTVICLFVLLNLKYYWSAVLVPSMVTAVIVEKTILKRYLVTSFLVVFLLLSLAASFTHPNFHLGRFLTVLVENHDLLVGVSPTGNVIGYYDLSPNWISIVVNSPWALWSGLFRPVIFEAQSLTGVAAAIENLFLLILVFWKLRSIRMPAVENRTIVLAGVAYILVLCIFLALSTPNLGTLSRYRVGFLPFFVLMILADHPLWKLKILINKK